MITLNTSALGKIAEAIAQAYADLEDIRNRDDLLWEEVDANVEYYNGYIAGLRLAKALINRETPDWFSPNTPTLMSYYRITFTTPDGLNKSVIRAASSVWHAVEIIYSKHHYLQPDRSQYKAKSLNWSLHRDLAVAQHLITWKI